MNFLKPKGPREQLLQVQGKFRDVKRKIGRERFEIEKHAKIAEQELKKLAKSGNLTAVRQLAAQLVVTRKQITKFYEAEATVDSINRTVSSQMRMNQCLQALSDSTQVIGKMNQLYSLPQISKDMRELSKEMMKMKLIDEMVSDIMEQESPTDEASVQAEIDAVIASVITDKLQDAPSVRKDSLPAMLPGPSQPISAEEEAEDAALKDRLQALLDETS
ncbi:Charged multivesicular body protein 3 [Cichlidogyrus casuarinus]|uniref:Charged multivesicular body protein 3 n=1 Tax=Cichlidogyrus casuarinus TaxID=1844966 RepID=A0ABD2PVB0_9PLAT